MPIEIKELIIKTNVVSDPHQQVHQMDQGNRIDEHTLEGLKKDIVRECVEQLLEKFSEKHVR